MSFVRFVTFFDDNDGKIIGPEMLSRYTMTALPVNYFCNDLHYIDGISTSVLNFSNLSVKEGERTQPMSPAGFIQHIVYERALEQGYYAVFMICPHAKFTNYYKTAVIAAKRFYRNHKTDGGKLKIYIINTKTFAAGTMLYAIDTAIDFHHNHNSTDVLAYYAKANANQSRTYMLTTSDTAFGKCNSMAEYEIIGNKVHTYDVSGYAESAVFDSFAQKVSKAIFKNNGRYAVSVGGNCRFAGNIIGRIEKLTDAKPVTTAQYSIPSAAVLGSETICIHVQKR